MAKTTEFKMEVVEKIGVISESENGKSTLELRKTKVNDSETKFDLRNWWVDKDGVEKCGKGIRLTDDELYKLGEIINNMDSFE